MERGTDGESRTEPGKQNESERQLSCAAPEFPGSPREGNKALVRDKDSVTEVSAWLAEAYSENGFCR